MVFSTSKFNWVGLFAADTWKEGYQVLNLMDKQSLEPLLSKSQRDGRSIRYVGSLIKEGSKPQL